MFIKRTSTEDKFKGDYTKCPEIRSWTMDMRFGEHFWRKVLLGSTGQATGQCLVTPKVGLEISDSKVSQVRKSLRVKEDVFWFHITMEDV